MKRAVILHGTDGTPDELWLPLLRQQLESAGYEVFTPLLPNNHTPNKAVYAEFLQKSGWDFGDNIVIGHSSGATTVLNLLSAEWFPKIRAAVLVGVFLNERLLKASPPRWYDHSQFTNLFLDKYDPEVLKQKAEEFIFVHGSDDPFCDIKDAQQLCNQVNGSFITIQGGGHLAASSGIKELPQIVDQLRSKNLL